MLRLNSTIVNSTSRQFYSRKLPDKQDLSKIKLDKILKLLNNESIVKNNNKI
jgi:hypothetical protein